MGPAVTILLLLTAFIISATIVAVFPYLVNVDEPDGAQEVDIGAIILTVILVGCITLVGLRFIAAAQFRGYLDDHKEPDD